MMDLGWKEKEISKHLMNLAPIYIYNISSSNLSTLNELISSPNNLPIALSIPDLSLSLWRKEKKKERKTEPSRSRDKSPLLDLTELEPIPFVKRGKKRRRWKMITITPNPNHLLCKYLCRGQAVSGQRFHERTTHRPFCGLPIARRNDRRPPRK